MVKKHKKFNYNKDRRREFKKTKKQKNIKCNAVKEAWDTRKSMKANMADMGLVEKPNAAFRIPKSSENLIGRAVTSDIVDVVMKDAPSKKNVVKALEKEASQKADPAKLDIMSDPETMYITRLMDKYGDNFKAMAKDSRNFYQYTVAQIKRKINKFKNTPKHYQAYLNSKTQAMEVTS